MKKKTQKGDQKTQFFDEKFHFYFTESVNEVWANSHKNTTYGIKYCLGPVLYDPLGLQ